ncbi:hypothetical protein EDB81DRAFT_769464 [Dactylonectria macrodidyma]|uniref:DUF676 domain-containing protein n=1 Tax=Dactylonectria macrodidyma TaxID=307937 RepID=A0A9P9JM32_9HYPO|nr:hypothetical protein EDB81DRAFT_769464 [Dactylonectria macrodidyma]
MPALRSLATGGQSPKIDIVAVHGLNPKSKPVKQHAWDTWTKPDAEEAKGRLWLRDDLPNTLKDARIFLYEYDSRIFSGKREAFWDAGNEFLDRLRGKRRDEPRRPLMLIGHSLGGLLIKQALVNAHDNQHYAGIEASVKGIVFFGTPHEGGNKDEAKISLGFTAARIAKKLGFDSNDSIVKVLTPGSLFGDFLRESFRHQLENYFIVSFWEKESTLVTKESATFGLAGHRETILGLDADHSNMCKFNTKLDDDRDIYECVQNNITWLYDEAMKEANITARLESLTISSEHSIHQKSEFSTEGQTS